MVEIQSRCEARVGLEIIQKGVTRRTLKYGAVVDLGPDTVERDEIGNVQIQCDRCGFSDSLKTRIMVDFLSADGHNSHNTGAQLFLMRNCKKWKEIKKFFESLDGTDHSDLAPQSFLPINVNFL